jgi:hypothetical protein
LRPDITCSFFKLQRSIVNQSVLRVALLAAGFLAFEIGEPRQALVMSAASHSIQMATGVTPTQSSWTRWAGSWETVSTERLGQAESAAAVAEGTRLSPAEAIQVAIDWLTKAESKIHS